jgi:hypothetical protein
MTLAFALLLAGSAGCSTPFDLLSAPADLLDSAPASITIVSAPALTVGQSTKIAATIKDATGTLLTDVMLTWSTSNAAIATVATDGTVSALSSGTVTITASSGKAKGETLITVQPAGTPTAPPAAPTPPTTPPASGTPSPVTLPQTFATDMPATPAPGGSVIAVGATDDLQAAIDRANPGDVIELAAGAVFTGNYILRAKSATSTSWIVIRAASGIPAEGRRMTPALAAAGRLPRVQTPNNMPAFATEHRTHHYRLVGLEITPAPAALAVTALISLGTDLTGGQTTLDLVPHDLVLDRLYIHGSSTFTLRRGVALNSASSAVIDSYISDCHEQGADSQAIMGWNGPGPFKIVNNYLEGAGEVIMFGGGDPGVPNLVPSDIEVRHNHLTKPLAWKGSIWSIKNLFELKNASRVLVEGNVMENSWMAAQDGSGVVLKSTNQGNTAPWSGTSHVTVRRNIVRNIGGAFNIAARPEAYPADPLHSVVVTDNLVINVNVGQFTGTSRVFVVQGDVTDVSITHNTAYNETVPFGALVFAPVGAKVNRFSFSDNITATASNWGIFGDNTGPGMATITDYAPTSTFTGNVFAGSAGGNYPTGNFFTPAVSGVGFANVAGGDFTLLDGSPFKGKASDGRDPGADVSAVLAATNGVVLP